MKKILFAFLLGFCVLGAQAQIVEQYGGGYVTDNAVMDKIDILEIGRSIHVASVEEGKVVVRRFYRGKWEEFDQTPISGIFKLQSLKLFAYKAVPYLMCQHDGKFSVIRAVADKWEYVGEETFGEGNITSPDFSVIGEKPFIVYEDKDFEVLRMISLLDDSWYDVDLMESAGIKDYHLAENERGDVYFSYLDGAGITIKKVDQMTEDIAAWQDLTKKIKLENIKRIDDFEFVGNKAYLTYHNEFGPVIMTLEDLAKKWEVMEEAEETITLGAKSYNLNISEYYFFTSLSATGIPQFLKNNKKGVWGDVTDLSKKKARGIASCEYRNIIYVAYVDDASQKLMVKKIEKGLNDDAPQPTKKK